MYTSFQIPKPTDEQVLERAPLELFRCILNDPNVSTYGRRGQTQNGVDIYGKRNGDPEHYVGVQCKLKADDKQLTEKIVKEEVAKALNFVPELKEYFIITTAPDDAKLQQCARELEVKIKKDTGRKLSIQIWGWGTIEREAQRHPTALKELWPDFTPYADASEEKITQKIEASTDELKDEIIGLRATLAARYSTVSSASDDTADRDPLEKIFDSEIDGYRDKINEGKPSIALEFLKAMLDRVSVHASGRILFRIKANIASCHLALGNEEEGKALLFEACDHAPEEPKAKVNLALAHIYGGDWRKAVEVAREGLKAQPDNSELAGVLVQALEYDRAVDDPLAEIPKSLHQTKHVKVGQLFFLRQREDPRWWGEARRLSKEYGDEPFVVQAAGEAVFDELLRDENVGKSRIISAAQLEDARQALTTLLGLWQKVSRGEGVLAPQHYSLFTNLILACDLLHDLDTAKALIADANEEVIGDNDVAIRIAQLAFNQDERELLAEAIAKISDPVAKFHFEFYEALQRDDWQALQAITVGYEKKAKAEEQELVSVVHDLATVMNFEGEKRPEQLLKIRSKVREDLRGLVLLHDALRSLGFDEEADELFLEAVELAVQEDVFSTRAMLAHRAAKRNEWATVIRLMSAYVDLSSDTKELQLVATAYVNTSPATRAASEFFDRLSPEISGKLYYLEREAVFHYNRGALAKAESCYRRAIETSETAELGFYLPLLSVLLRRHKKEEVHLLVQEMLKLDLKGSGDEKAAFAHFIFDAGYASQSIELAYKALAESPESPEVHSAYCKLILINTRNEGDDDLIPAVNEVSSDCWVKVRSEQGELRELLISAVAALEPRHLFHLVADPSEHRLARSLIGKKLGDSVETKEAFGIAETRWTIIELKHKYLQALHTIMDEFHVRFPGVDQLGRIQTKGDDVQPILDHIRKRGEYHQDVLSYYTAQGFPIRVIAALQRTSTIQFAQFIQSEGHLIQCCRGLEVERTEAIAMIKEQRMKGAVLDAYTAWCAASLDLFPVLKKVFGKLFIAQSCLDELTKLAYEMDDTEGDSFSISWRDGAFYREEASAEEKKKRISYVQGILKQVGENCAAMPSEAPDELPEVSSELIQRFSQDLLDPVFVALAGPLLVSEDMYFRQLAAQEYSISSTWLQPVFMFALSEGIIDLADYCKFMIALASLQHEHLAVGTAELAKIGIEDKTQNLSEFTSLADRIGNKSADLLSHLSVTSGALRSIWVSGEIEELKKMRLTGVLVSRLLRYRQSDWHFGMALLFEASPQNIREYLYNWAIGHFLPLSKLQEAISELSRIRLTAHIRKHLGG